MKKYIITVIISLLVGFLLSNYMLKQYGSVDKILPVFGNTTYEVYLIQQGVYSSMDSMKENASKITDYIYSNIDGMYYVYVGITLDNDNVTKLQEYYKTLGINTIVKATKIKENEFISSLKQYDTILKETNDNETIKQLCKQILSKYQGG